MTDDNATAVLVPWRIIDERFFSFFRIVCNVYAAPNHERVSGHESKAIVVTEGKNTKIDKKMPYTRESLLAEWEEIRPSEPMPIELQNLFLMMFANAPAVRSVDAIVRPCLVQAAAPPPQRYQRRRSAIISQDVAPLGPSEACLIQASTDLRTTISSIRTGPDEDH